MCKLYKTSPSQRSLFTRSRSSPPWLWVQARLVLWVDMGDFRAMRNTWIFAAWRGSGWWQVPFQPTLCSFRMLRQSPQTGRALYPAFWQITPSPIQSLGLWPIKEKQLMSGYARFWKNFTFFRCSCIQIAGKKLERSPSKSVAKGHSLNCNGLNKVKWGEGDLHLPTSDPILRWIMVHSGQEPIGNQYLCLGNPGSNTPALSSYAITEHYIHPLHF